MTQSKGSRKGPNITYLKAGDDLKDYRNKVLKEQGGFDPILQDQITDPVLDHSHFDGHCRSVLQREMNAAEGKVYNAFKQYLGHLAPKADWPNILCNLAEYWLTDFSMNPVHPEELKVDVNRFKKLNAPEQIKLLEAGGVDCTNLKNSSVRGRHARVLLKSGKLSRETVFMEVRKLKLRRKNA